MSKQESCGEVVREKPREFFIDRYMSKIWEKKEGNGPLPSDIRLIEASAYEQVCQELEEAKAELAEYTTVAYMVGAEHRSDDLRKAKQELQAVGPNVLQPGLVSRRKLRPKLP